MARGIVFKGAGGGHSVAYAARMAAVTSFLNNTFSNQMSSLADTELVNNGGFTIDTESSVDRVVIPESGNYAVAYILSADVNNDSVASSLYTLQAKIVREDSEGTVTDISLPAYALARGEYLSALSLASTDAASVYPLEGGDLIWGEIAAYRQSPDVTATVNGEIQIVKLQAGQRGDKGDKGDTGDKGDKGDKGDAGDEENTDTHPDISFPGFPDQTDIYDGVEPGGIGFSVYRDSAKMSRITTGTPSASQYLVSTSNSSGLNSTFTYESLSRQIDVTGVSLNDTVVAGARANISFVFTFTGDDGSQFDIRKHMEFRRVDTDDFGTDQDLSLIHISEPTRPY